MRWTVSAISGGGVLGGSLYGIGTGCAGYVVSTGVTVVVGPQLSPALLWGWQWGDF